ncbi:hypothetical protein PUNSTDRAFT_47213 [Punctularia strigosozonata HHB-11173 SS5]|uniref:Uncharacterized protein n=1 Tax=Punctularia strigosozonata (strain HHB-11173) TaxID=741275 RepID=R7S3I8_PUNST|nr:uncharacterized protein PUNSTDRAFT_47213 [Punctularia strigosozonata HHB-11173 SS5]EIN04975.1 hypothetical protein PUNSTDRAFT_47213 [Punctularia strigosozonata HHB-11173 SS5]
MLSLQIFTALIALLVSPFLASARPAARRNVNNFFLVATPTKTAHPTTSTGLNLIDPFHQEQFFLRAQEDAASYSEFNLTKGTLETLAMPPNLFTLETYESNIDTDSGEFFFLPESGTPGLFSFHGQWLAFNGSTSGFTICEPSNAIENPVVYWKGTDSTCVDTFIFRTTTDPASTST